MPPKRSKTEKKMKKAVRATSVALATITKIHSDIKKRPKLPKRGKKSKLHS